MKRRVHQVKDRGGIGPKVRPGTEFRTQHLSGPRRRLVQMMQKLGYGRIKRLAVEDGEPVLSPPPTRERFHVFGRKKRPPRDTRPADFVLKNKLVELFEIFDRERTLVIKELAIEDGLPVRMTVAESPPV